MAQLRQPSGATSGAQPVAARLPPDRPPVRHRLMTDAHLARDLGWDDPVLE
jgi:hypothetical protein